MRALSSGFARKRGISDWALGLFHMAEIVLPDGRVVNYSFHVEEAAKWDKESFIVWLERELHRRGWSEAELGRRLGASSGTVNRWVHGERRPSPNSCDLLADLI